MVPGDHDYTRALCEHLPADEVSLWFLPEELPPRYMDPRRFPKTDLLHIHWPEHLFDCRGLAHGSLVEGYLTFIRGMEQRGCRVIWTLHNRAPHKKDPALFAPVYRAFAQAARGAIHHSEWGEMLMRSELPFSLRCRHTVIYHGHYEQQMRCTLSRESIERRYGLTPAGVRLGVLGRAQKTKNTQQIVRAFVRAARPDQQMLLDAIDETEAQALPRDGRLTVLTRRGWLPRSEVTRRVHAVDALVVAHSGPSYLSSGLIADALALSLPMLVPRWGFFVEMLGAAAIYHDNTEAGIEHLFRELTPEQLAAARAAMRELKPRFEWSRLAAQTLSFYRDAMGSGP